MGDRQRIEQAADKYELGEPLFWRDSEDGLIAYFGEWIVGSDDVETQGLIVGDIGELRACVVGAEQYGNRRVAFSLHPRGVEGGYQVPGDPTDVLDPAD